MPLRVGFVTAAHVHTYGLLHGFRHNQQVEVVGLSDHDATRGDEFCKATSLKSFPTLEALLDHVDAVVICSENKLHAEQIAQAASKGKHIFCEKPLVTSDEEAKLVSDALKGTKVKIMTALPVRYAPVFARLRERIAGGEIGAIKAICTTNHGMNPGGWFNDPDLAGGGALMDHSVHVADLLYLLLKETPSKVEAQIGYNMENMVVDDCAMLTLDYPSGIFVTIDASWSRPKSFKTWGDVTLNVVGEKGVIEVDVFAQQIQVYSAGETTHRVADYGSDMGQLLVDDFVDCVLNDKPSPIPLEDGLASSRVVIEAYKHVNAPSTVPPVRLVKA